MNASGADPERTQSESARGCGLGWRLGIQVRQWLNSEPERLRGSQALANRLMDALGSDDTLRGPLRDLASQPLLERALQGHGASRLAAVEALSQHLGKIYAPEVLAELLDLLEAATGLPRPRPAPAATPAAPPGSAPAATPEPHGIRLKQRMRQHGPVLAAIGPGLGLAASGSLVFAWLARELDRAVFEGWGWSGGVVLVLVLALMEALCHGPLKTLRESWSMNEQQALQPRQAWRWLRAPWIHQRSMEALLNVLLLLLILGASPLQLGDVVLRYSLTNLATLVPAVVLAQRWNVAREWSGGSGAISALVALAAGVSLLKGEMVHLHFLLFSVPVWVLFLVNSALQLNWQLPATRDESRGQGWQRLICSQWAWGLILGSSWALITRGRELIMLAGLGQR